MTETIDGYSTPTPFQPRVCRIVCNDPAAYRALIRLCESWQWETPNSLVLEIDSEQEDGGQDA
jgi:hypothetical protein